MCAVPDETCWDQAWPLKSCLAGRIGQWQSHVDQRDIAIAIENSTNTPMDTMILERGVFLCALVEISCQCAWFGTQGNFLVLEKNERRLW